VGLRPTSCSRSNSGVQAEQPQAGPQPGEGHDSCRAFRMRAQQAAELLLPLSIYPYTHRHRRKYSQPGCFWYFGRSGTPWLLRRLRWPVVCGLGRPTRNSPRCYVLSAFFYLAGGHELCCVCSGFLLCSQGSSSQTISLAKEQDHGAIPRGNKGSSAHAPCH
jgi:hypothetical protein